MFLHKNIHLNVYYNYLKKEKVNYHRQKKVILDTIRDIYYEYSGSIGGRFMKLFLGRWSIYLSKTTVYKYINKELNEKVFVEEGNQTIKK